jgi:class 3 adenylate cyclase
MEGDPPADTNPSALDSPYPLLRRFLGRIVPGAAVFAIVSALALGTAVVRVIEDVYLEIAEVRAQGILRSVQRVMPVTASALMAGKLGEADVEALTRFLATMPGEPRLQRIKIYDLSRRVLFSSNLADLGATEDNPALRAVIAGRVRRLVDHREGDGTRVYELYVPIISPDGKFNAVMELYEPTDYLDRTVAVEIWPPVALSVALLAALFMALYVVVRAGQGDITARSQALTRLRQRFERLVSSSAVGAVHAAQGGALASRRMEVTLLYADVRNFTALAESAEPEIVVDFLNRLLAIEVARVREFGGDVDKMIGDALLARFAGEGRQARALAAAAAVLAAVQRADLPRGIGVGVHDGTVIAGAIGPEERQDFTVIGDAVNTAARLCAAAKAGELVCDESTLATAGWPLAMAEEITVKGKQAILRIGRFSTDEARRVAAGDA